MMSMAATILLLLAFPPLGWWPLAWVALVPLVAVIKTPRFETAHPWRSIWFSGWVFWGLQVYYVPMPHPALWVAWLLLFSYLSIYPLLFVWISRKMVHGLGCPALLAAPIVMTAMEWVRAHALSGFGFVMLSNSQYEVPLLLQVCDLFGAYGLTFLMTLFAAGVCVALCGQRLGGLAVSGLVLAFVLGYGFFKLDSIEQSNGSEMHVAIVQGNIDTRFPATEAEMREYGQQLFREYLNLQKEWMQEQAGPAPELFVWPEGKYPVPYVLPGGDEDDASIRENFRTFHSMLYAGEEAGFNQEDSALPLMIVGATTFDPEKDKQYNSALLVGKKGKVLGAYHKMELVPFGEFVPFSKWFPLLGKMTPIGNGIDRGTQPVAFNINGNMAMPIVCFESASTHHVRESVAYLRSSGKEPDFLVNITDDGWFYGQTALDQHLACNVIRAVENRKPLFVAANTGLSAMIQSSGEIISMGPRRNSEVLDRTLELKTSPSLYATVGDWPVILMTLLCVLAVLLPARKQAVVAAATGTQD